MSTYLYLVCPHHREPVRASEESGQHTYDLPTIRLNWLQRDGRLHYIDRFPEALEGRYAVLSYFERATYRFLQGHRDCGTPHIESVYGVHDIEAPTIEALLDCETTALPVGRASSCEHPNVRTFRSLPPHSRCLDCDAAVEQRWSAVGAP